MAYERFSAVLKTYESLRPLMRSIPGQFGKVECLLDIGCGDGIVTMLLADDIGPERLALADIAAPPRATFRLPHWFYRLDVCSPDFVTTFQGKVQVITCICAFHEFDDPAAAARNIASLVPPNGCAIIIDRSESGWAMEKELSRFEGELALKHYEEDRAKLQRSGLGTDAGIRDFWEKRISSQLPGMSKLMMPHEGNAYSFVYANITQPALRAA